MMAQWVALSRRVWVWFPDWVIRVLSVWGLHVVPVSVWVFSRCFWFPPSVQRHVDRLIGHAKPPSVRMYMCDCHEMAWQPVQGVSCPMLAGIDSRPS